jgi:hypothetical protein
MVRHAIAANMPGAAVESRIIDVWQSNLCEEFVKIRNLIKDYSYIAMVGIINAKLILKNSCVNLTC